jgi:class 3 adenylate cyclase/tetratricopeptide (TPR) repeat protein
MIACPSCGFEAPDDFAFCPKCATALSAAPPIAEERKVVTTLFCDVVSFTAMCEAADPEDVDAILRRYHAAAREVIESYGGTVEKFIGDAVVGVFGVPAAHEDDPERAVRAGLRLIEAMEGMTRPDGSPLQVRIGINTGEALVRLDVDPASGRGFLTGDAVNTAARLQSVAPPEGVAVGSLTHELTFRVIEYEELPPVAAKGKAEPVLAWQARAPLARLGIDASATDLTPLVGREMELSYLAAVFDKAMAQSTPQIALIVGEPGIGKSRLVRELFAYVDGLPELVTWRQGYCPPFGEDITYWALAEIVKGHAGIRDTDQYEAVDVKLEAVLPSGPDREWFRQRLRALLGLTAPEAAREENFTAWLRFFEDMAARGPTVLVFEDLHWADQALLAFLEHLTTHVASVPLLILGTARPELFEREPGFAASAGVNRIGLGPLSPAETARLVAGLLGQSDDRAKAVGEVVRRCDGNPFYAEQSVRLLSDTTLDALLPDSVQAVIAARLDTLPAEQKTLLGDAAVVGSVFWDGAVAALEAREPPDLDDTLSALLERKLIRRIRESSMEGEREFAFVHALARDVAYAQLPRTSRAVRHVAAAAWLESKARGRVEDLADVLAYHYATALELARAAAQTEQAAELEQPALRFLSLAGERALGLDTTAALGAFERALALAPPGHPGRPEALARFGEAALQAGRFAQAAEALEEAIATFRARGDLAAATRASSTLSSVLSLLGDPRWSEVPAEALALLEPLPPGPELVGALTEVAVTELFRGRSEAAVGYAERALTLAEKLGLDRSPRALGFRGLARSYLGDPEGLEDMREAIELATQAGQGREVALLHNNLGWALCGFEGPGAALEVQRAGIAFAQARGLTEMVDGITADTLDSLFDSGEPEVALAVAAGLAERLEASEAVLDLVHARATQARVLALRGQTAQAAGWLDWLESGSRGTHDQQIVIMGLGASVLARAGLGQDEAAAALLAEIEGYPGARENTYYPAYLPAMVRTALRIGNRELAVRLASGYEPRYPYAEHALVAANAALAEARGDLEDAAQAYAEAANRWERFGVVPEQAYALLGQGRCLLGLAGPSEAAHVLNRAHAIFHALGAAPALAETDALLQKVSSA